MKKSVIAVLVLAAAGIVLPAGYFGQVTETTLRERMANMPYGFQMELTDYRRGWFSSTARLEWDPLVGLPMPGLGPQGALPGAAASRRSASAWRSSTNPNRDAPVGQTSQQAGISPLACRCSQN